MVFEYLDKDLKRFMDDFEPMPGCPGVNVTNLFTVVIYEFL
jgi:hypothetical protein